MNGPQGWVWNGSIDVPGHKPVSLFVELLAFVHLVQVLCWAASEEWTGQAPMTAIGVELLPRVTVDPRGPLEQLGQHCVESWKNAVQQVIAERQASLPELVRTAAPSPSS